ncbi:MAG: TonB-dependent receptor [Salinivirgaceae bacterium]|jgi:vitamin B12 transporter|nr:TonB-dependent receptor [Salinivirgaceae bacterium]
MDTKNFTKQLSKHVTFSHWSRKSFAIFASLKTIVKIGFLSGTLTLLANPEKGYSQTDTIQVGNHLDIDEVVVSSNRTPKAFEEVSRIVTVIPSEEIQASPAQTLQDLLRYAMNVDIRQRGAIGVQADVSIRGGSFDQTLFLLNNIPVNDPQTGHHNLNIPIDLESIERIEILSGAGARIFGPNAFSGAINIITNSKADKEIRASVSGGQNGLYATNASVNFSSGKLNNYIAFGLNGSDGYKTNTDFKSKQVFYHGSLNADLGKLDFQLGYLDKSFGANSFYSPKYPDQFEHIRNFLTSLSYSKSFGIAKLTTNIYWRRNQDRFELFREDKFHYNDGYFVTTENDTAKYYQINYSYPGHNYHLTNVTGANANISVSTKLGESSFGVDFRNEHIYSNVLGESLDEAIDAPGEERGKYSKEAERSHVNFFIEQDYTNNKYNITLGGLAHYNSDYGAYFSGGVETSYWLTSGVKTFASINQAMRMPTFTDLYYDGPSNVGNPELKPEVANGYELGFKGYGNNVTWTVNGFARDTKDAIDWVKEVGADEFTTVNYTNLITSGLELSSRMNFKKVEGLSSFVNYINVSYSYTNIDKETDTLMVSAYSLDYLRHKINITADHNLYKSLGLSWSVSYQSRNGAYTDILGEEISYMPFTLFDAKLYWRANKYEIFSEVTNIFNTDYYDLGGISQPGRWIRGGIKVNLNFN